MLLGQRVKAGPDSLGRTLWWRGSCAGVSRPAHASRGQPVDRTGGMRKLSSLRDWQVSDHDPSWHLQERSSCLAITRTFIRRGTSACRERLEGWMEWATIPAMSGVMARTDADEGAAASRGWCGGMRNPTRKWQRHGALGDGRLTHREPDQGGGGGSVDDGARGTAGRTALRTEWSRMPGRLCPTDGSSIAADGAGPVA